MPRRAPTQRRLEQKLAGFVVVPPTVLLLCIGDTILFMKVHPLKIRKSTRIQPFYAFFDGMFRVDVKKTARELTGQDFASKNQDITTKTRDFELVYVGEIGF